MKKILFLSDSLTFTTGYSVTCRRIIDIFQRAGCDVRQLAFGLNEDNVDNKDIINHVSDNVKIYPYNGVYLYLTSRQDYFGKAGIFQHVCDSFLPDVVFSFHDLHNISWIFLYPNRWFKWVGYFPVDAEYLTVAQKYIVNQMDMPIVYSKTGLNAVINATQRQDTRLIYHGLDTNTFVPMDKYEVKRKYGLQEKFIVGAVGRNNPRKNYPALIKSFAEFAKDKEDVLLYLHTLPIDVGHNLYEFIHQYKISEKILITQDMNASKGIDLNELVEVYNLFDICVSATCGEGLGLTSLESQLCETPVLITDYSACKEFVPKQMRIKVDAYYFEPLWDLERAIINQQDLINKLNLYYHNRDTLPIIGKQCREFALGFDWKYIEPLFKYLALEFGAKDNNNDNNNDNNKNKNNILDKYIKI